MHLFWGFKINIYGFEFLSSAVIFFTFGFGINREQKHSFCSSSSFDSYRPIDISIDLIFGEFYFCVNSQSTHDFPWSKHDEFFWTRSEKKPSSPENQPMVLLPIIGFIRKSSSILIPDPYLPSSSFSSILCFWMNRSFEIEMSALQFGDCMVFRGGFGGGGATGFVGSSSNSSMKATNNAAAGDVLGPEMKAAMAMKSHCEAERRRRERINSHLSTLRGLVPTTSKVYSQYFWSIHSNFFRFLFLSSY